MDKKSLFIPPAETCLRIFTTFLLVGPTVNREEMFVKSGTYVLYNVSQHYINDASI